MDFKPKTSWIQSIQGKTVTEMLILPVTGAAL